MMVGELSVLFYILVEQVEQVFTQNLVLTHRQRIGLFPHPGDTSHSQQKHYRENDSSDVHAHLRFIN